jgi:hypothetical protein
MTIPQCLIDSQRPRQRNHWEFAAVKSASDRLRQLYGETDPQWFVAYQEEDGQLSKLEDVLCSS